MEPAPDAKGVPNRISATLHDHQLSEALNCIHQLRQTLPFLAELEEDERFYVLQIQPSMVPFMEAALVQARTHSHLLPHFLDVDEMGRDLDLFHKLEGIIKPLEELLRQLNEAAMAAGSDAFESAITFYKAVRMGAREGDHGAEEVLENLRMKLPNLRRAQPMHINPGQ